MVPSIRFTRETLSRFDDAVKKEWLATNGLGGYASSTALSVNTRKYHGLLVAALNPPRDRRVFLSKLDEEITLDGRTYPLGANEFREGVFPKGHKYISEFAVSPLPRFVYDVEGVNVKKRIFLPHGRNAVVVLYDVVNGHTSALTVRVSPLVSWRHFHAVIDRWKSPADFSQTHDDKELEISFKSPSSVLAVKTTEGHYSPRGKWVERLFYREEESRGESCLDDCYEPGYFEMDVGIGKSESFSLVAAAAKSKSELDEALDHMPRSFSDAQRMYERELERLNGLVNRFYETQKCAVADWLSWLVLASDAFVVTGGEDSEAVVVAGYHWFEAWGRDTFVSLPGLLLLTGRFEEARKVFATFNRYCRQGMIPNFLPDQAGPPAYNTVDASLWFVNAVLQYLKYTGDFRFVHEQLWETLKDIVDSYARGTAFGIRMDGDGLLCHGPQLTWMDAVVDGRAVTPRGGKAVEVQALWYNALRTAQMLAGGFGEDAYAERCAAMAEKVRKSFVEKFWNPRRNCLFDAVAEDGSEEESLRPNQIFAVALDFQMIDRAHGEKVVDVVQRELLTSRGVRTLAVTDPRYVGLYVGDRAKRDEAYHNGTVWPWLLGPLTTSFLKTEGYTDSGRDYAFRTFLADIFTKGISEACLGAVGEIFDGNEPHSPRGCIAQAWSVAELLRAYVEDVLQIRPRFEKEVLGGLV